MRRSAILKDVPHSELERELGNHIERGWAITAVVAQAWMRYDTGASAVTHWIIVMERHVDRPIEYR